MTWRTVAKSGAFKTFGPQGQPILRRSGNDQYNGVQFNNIIQCMRRHQLHAMSQEGFAMIPNNRTSSVLCSHDSIND